eukprot:613779-Prymnesium_polylepis.1
MASTRLRRLRHRTDAWPAGQDVCRLIKQRCREICPSLRVFLDVEDLVTGGGTKEVDHSQCILVFAMPVYFEKVNCVKEMMRTIVRNKPITLLLPDAEVHGTFTTDMIRNIVTDEWVKKWKIAHRITTWASEWGADLAVPSPTQICDALFTSSALEWSRMTPFQDETLLLMCQRLIPSKHGKFAFLHGAPRFKLRKGHEPLK